MASEIKKPIFHHLRGRAVNEEESIPKFFKDAPVLREIVRKQVSEESTKQNTKQLLTQTQESPNAEQSNPQDDANPLDCAVEYSDLNISEDKGVSPINGKNEISLDLEFKKEIDQVIILSLCFKGLKALFRVQLIRKIPLSEISSQRMNEKSIFHRLAQVIH